MKEKLNIQLDEKDKKILNLLVTNSKLSFRQIAKEINTSAATVLNRIKRLEKEKVIKGYYIAIDYERIGYDIPVLIEIQVAHGKLKQVEEKIAQSPKVLSVFDTTGQFDIAVVAKFKNRQEMDKFIKKIQTYSFIERTNTKIILNIVKDEYMKIR